MLHRFLELIQWQKFQTKLVTIFTGLILLSVSVITAHSYYMNSRTTLAIANDLITEVTRTVRERTVNYFAPAQHMAELTARLVESEGGVDLTDAPLLERFLSDILPVYPQLAMLYIANEEGDLLMAHRQPDDSIAVKIVDRDDGRETAREIWRYYDTPNRPPRETVTEGVDYDPRWRTWYIGAKATDSVFWSEIYIFRTGGMPGITATHTVDARDGGFWGVVAADLTLHRLSDFLKTLQIGQTGTAFIAERRTDDADRPYLQIIAHPEKDALVHRDGAITRPLRGTEFGRPRLRRACESFLETDERHFVYTCRGERYMARFTAFPPSFQKNWTIGVVVPEQDFVGGIQRAHMISLLISLGVLLISILCAVLLARNVSRPIERLCEEARKIQDLDLEGDIDIESHIYEIHQMSASMASMKTGLRAFQKYVPAALVRRLIQTGEGSGLGGHERDLTLFFSDIAGFTPISERMEPRDLMLHLSEYLDALTTVIQGERGVVDKYIGDAIMAFWGAPEPDPNHVVHACRAALCCRRTVEKLNRRWRAEGKVELPTRIGIHTGRTIVGNIGSRDRWNYTMLGDTVNLASRLEGVNKFYGTSVLVSQATREQAGDTFVFRPVDLVAVKGKRRGSVLYELIGAEDDSDAAERIAFAEGYAAAFDSYRRREWREALERFETLATAHPEDHPARIFVDRCREYLARDPGPDWDGLVHLEAK